MSELAASSVRAPRLPRRKLAASLAGVALVVAGCGTSGEANSGPSDTKPSNVTTSPSAAGPSSLPAKYPVGYDISWAQCDKPLPTSGAFAIIQITGGRADLMSPCLKDQVEWAGSTLDGSSSQPKAQYYIWPANPGSNYRGQKIASWPKTGRNMYGVCDGSDGQACSYEYGRFRGRQAMSFAEKQIGSKALGTVYIDVESGVGDELGTWQTKSAHNLAAIAGYQTAIRESGSKPGIYSNAQHLETVLNPEDAVKLSDLPEWTTGSGTVEDARTACDSPFIKGAKVVLSQYKISQTSVEISPFDLNYACVA